MPSSSPASAAGMTPVSRVQHMKRSSCQLHFARWSGQAQTSTVTGRAMIALMENFQQEDGSIAIPSALHEFGAPARLGAERTRA